MTDRDQSYKNRVSRGQVVTLKRDVTGVVYDHSIKPFTIVDRPVAPKGAQVLVISETNAGFRGIEFSFEYNGQRSWHGITTAAVDDAN